MKLYSAADLHSNNHFLTIIDEQDKRILEKRLPNNLAITLKTLEPYRPDIAGVAVESTFNWYWLVDGLMEAGYPVMLVNTSKVRQYEGLKYTDDRHDAFWLAQLMRLGILPTGYIYPKEQRALRDLLRERRRLVCQRTTNVLSIQSTIWRNTAIRVPGKVILGEKETGWPQVSDPNIKLGVQARRATIKELKKQIDTIEDRVLKHLKPSPVYKILLTVPGIGPVIAWTIVLEAGDLSRFANVGHFSSYCRCVDSRKIGNPYLAWAFFEAAHFAIQYLPAAKRFYEKKAAQRNKILAMKALSHKLARACYYVMRDQVPFDPARLFG
jgi:transposase